MNIVPILCPVLIQSRDLACKRPSSLNWETKGESMILLCSNVQHSPTLGKALADAPTVLSAANLAAKRYLAGELYGVNLRGTIIQCTIFVSLPPEAFRLDWPFWANPPLMLCSLPQSSNNTCSQSRRLDSCDRSFFLNIWKRHIQ
jgi:hypothetical protein